MAKKYHYVYRITNIKERMYYYGVRSCDCLPKEDIGIKYWSSIKKKEFIKDQKENPGDYKYKVIKIFSTRVEAVQHEIFLHKKFDVKLHEKFYNDANQTSTSFDTTGKVSCKDTRNNKQYSVSSDEFYANEFYIGVSSGISKDNSGSNNPMFGKTHSEETKIKIGLKSIGRQTFKDKEHSDESKRKISESRLLLMQDPIRYDNWKKSLAKYINTILIYDNYDNLIYTSDCNFSDFCKQNNLPSTAFVKSYKNNTKLYQNHRPSDEKRLINNGNIKFKGWYAIKID